MPDQYHILVRRFNSSGVEETGYLTRDSYQLVNELEFPRCLITRDLVAETIERIMRMENSQVRSFIITRY